MHKQVALLVLWCTVLGVGVGMLLLAAAIPVITVGVAGYLATGTGARPAEAAVQAFDLPVPFRWGYSTFHATGSLVGWRGR